MAVLSFPIFPDIQAKGLVAYATRAICTKTVLESLLFQTFFVHIACSLLAATLLIDANLKNGETQNGSKNMINVADKTQDWG